MQRTLHGMCFRGNLTGLVMKQIDSVAGMMPEQMIRPASGFSFRIHVGPAEEKCLNDQMLQLEFTGFDSLVDPLMAWIESPSMSAHRYEAGLFLHRKDSLGVGKRV